MTAAKAKLKKAIEARNKKVEADNVAFDAMSKDDQRRQIAKDVIAWIETSRLTPESGVYLSPVVRVKDEDGVERTMADDYESLKDMGVKTESVMKIVACNACAIGSMFLCAMDRKDKVGVKNIIDLSDKQDKQMRTFLSKYFPKKELTQMENIFEGRAVRYRTSTEAEELSYFDDVRELLMKAEEEDEAAEDRGENNGSKESELRLKLVMQNVIANGHFDITKRPKYGYVTPGYTG